MFALTGTIIDSSGEKKGKAVLIDGNRIARVVDQARLRDYDVNKVYGGEGYVILPGLINAHTHVAMAKFRGLGENLPTEEWLEKIIWPMEREWNRKELGRWVLLGLAEALANGSTTVNDHYFFAGEVAKAAQKIGIRAFIGQTVMDIQDFPLALPEDGIRFFKRWWGKDELVTPTLAPHATNTVSYELMVEIGEMAREYRAKIHMHVSQSLAEVRDVKERYGVLPVELLQRAGLLNPHFVGVHGIYMSEKEKELYARSGATLVHCPTSNLMLEGRTVDVGSLRTLGVNLALGNDSPNPTGILDMFAEMRTAVLAAKAFSNGEIKDKEALEMATLGGARALGLDAGMIKKGALADLVLLKTDKPWFLPKEGANVVGSARGSDVSVVVVNGEVVYRDGLFTRLGKTLEEIWAEGKSFKTGQEI
jgi:5-methylthioadenosine/S-adenosylhomocysteine deaminase